MQIVINVDRDFVARLGVGLALLGAGLVLLAPHSARAGALTIPNAFVPGTTISASEMNANFSAIEAEVDDNAAQAAAVNSRVAALEALLAGVTRSGTTLQISGLNLQLVNGGGASSTANGTGNLIVGYDEAGTGARTGSHNVVIGPGHSYESTSGLAVGQGHRIAAEGAVAVGGRNNRALGQYSVVLGGESSGVDTGGGAGDDGLLTTVIASLNDGESEDRVMILGLNTVFAGVGEGAGLIRIGDDSGACLLGKGTGQIELGGVSGEPGSTAPGNLIVQAGNSLRLISGGQADLTGQNVVVDAADQATVQDSDDVFSP